jgi:membrane protein
MQRLRALGDVFRQAGIDWWKVKAPRLGAALAYYTVLSLAPILVIAIAVAGAVYGEEAARGELVGQIRDLVGPQGAEAVQTMIANSAQGEASLIATLIGLAVLVFSATVAFTELQDALNTIWGVQPKGSGGLLGLVRDRLLSFALVVAVGFLLLVSLIISTVLAAAGKYFGDLLPSWAPILQLVHLAVSFAVITLLFALIFKVLPDVELSWRHVWIGAAMTALLFVIGKSLIGLYLGQASIASTYGAAGSLVVLLVWVYYSAQIMLYGAEFTRVYALRSHQQPIPKRNAEAVTPEARAREGIPASPGWEPAAQR